MGYFGNFLNKICDKKILDTRYSISIIMQTCFLFSDRVVYDIIIKRELCVYRERASRRERIRISL